MKDYRKMYAKQRPRKTRIKCVLLIDRHCAAVRKGNGSVSIQWTGGSVRALLSAAESIEMRRFSLAGHCIKAPGQRSCRHDAWLKIYTVHISRLRARKEGQRIAQRSDDV